MHRLTSVTILMIVLALATTALAQDSSGVTCEASRFLNWGHTANIAVRGNYVYASTGETGLHIVDVSDSTNPIETGSCITPGYTLGIALSENYAYVADSANGFSGLQIFDISNPATPFQAGFVPLSTAPISVFIVDHYVYIGENYGIRILDITTPTEPIFVRILSSGLVYEFARSGNSLLVASNAFRIYNIADPANPVLTGSLAYDCRHVTVDSNYVYISGPTNFRVIDISNRFNPQQIAYRYQSYDAGNTSIADHYAYIASSNRMIIFDITNPRSPVPIDTVVAPLYASISKTFGNRLYLTSWTGFSIFNIANPAAPQLTSESPDQGWDFDVVQSGNYAYLADGRSGLRIYDVSNPAQLVQISRCLMPGFARSVTLSGQYAYVSARNGGMRIIDVSNPVTPFGVGNFTDSGMTRGYGIEAIAVSGRYAYLADQDVYFPDSSRGIRIVDIDTLSAPHQVGNYQHDSFHPLAVKVVGNYAYVSDGIGLEILDLTNPTAPTLVSSFVTSNAFYSTLHNLTISGHYAYLPKTSYGVCIADIADPATPLEVGTMNTPDNEVYSVAVSGNYAFVTSGLSGLRIFNISNPAAPIEIGYYNTPGRAVGVSVSGSHVLVADYNYLSSYNCEQALGVVDRVPSELPLQLTLRQNYPNPFNASSTLEYTLPKAGKVELKLFDPMGREVGTLVDFQQSAGSYRVKLDGSTLSSGTYFCRLSCNGNSAIKKMVLLK